MVQSIRKAFAVSAVWAAVFQSVAFANDLQLDNSVVPRAQNSTIDIDKLCKGYTAKNVRTSSTGLVAELQLIGNGCAVYGKDFTKLKLEVTYEEKTRLHVKISDANGPRYEVPEIAFERPKSHGVSSKSSDLEFRLIESPFSFSVLRRSSKEVLFSTDSYALVFEPQFLRIKSSLPAGANIYGLGEHTDPFRLEIEKGTTRTIFARDAYGIPRGTNLYGHHPIYVEQRTTGTHGVFLLNSNGMDVKLYPGTHPKTKKPISTVEYNAIGGVFDFYFFAGPDPTSVSQQYSEVAGLPAMIPYWGLGLHQCRWGYQDWIEVAEVIANYTIAKIPLETMWTDIDYMNSRWIFTTDPERYPLSRVRQIVDLLHSRNQHYILMVDPAVARQNYPSYLRGTEKDVWAKEADGSVFKGVVWPGVTVYPDWFANNTQEFWTDEFRRFFDADTGVNIDGVWIDMNEPANFCRYPCPDADAAAIEQGMPPAPPPVRPIPRPIPGFPDTYPGSGVSARTIPRAEPMAMTPMRREVTVRGTPRVPLYHTADEDLNVPPYEIGNAADFGLGDRTIHMDTVHPNGLAEYDTHSLYGHMMSLVTQKAMATRRPGKRTLIITRSTFAGAGKFVGKWLGDNLSNWDHYRWQIAGMLNFATIFQIPMVGSDVCGFGDSTTEELCSRWATLGAFNPFFRNHNAMEAIAQEFYRWKDTTTAARNGIGIRFRLMDYLYTAIYKQTKDGTPSLNPLFYLYPKDSNTYPIDLQFIFGRDILVSPVTDQGATSVTAYFPQDIFYDFFTGEKLIGRGANVTLTNIAVHEIPVHIRGGAVIPLRLAVDEKTGDVPMSTADLRKRDFELVIAPGKDGRASGNLYLDDGESLVQKKGDVTEVSFSYSNNKLRVKGVTGRKVVVKRVVLLGATGDALKPKSSKGVKVTVDKKVGKVVYEKQGGWVLSAGELDF